MKKIAAIAAVIVVMFALTTSAAAQNSRILGRANVPFAFAAQGTGFAAGQYEVRLIGSNLLKLRNVANGQDVLLIPSMDTVSHANPKLSFRRVGEGMYLSAVTSPECSCTAELPTPRNVKMVRKGDSNVVVAMK